MLRVRGLLSTIRRPRSIGMLVLALAFGVESPSTFGANKEGPTTLAFLIATSDLGFLYGKFEEECPQGFELTLEEEYLASLTPEQRSWMLRPENSFEYSNAWKNDFATGSGNTNVCSNPKSFRNDTRRRFFRGPISKVAYGLNLDGTTDGGATAKTCAHQKFEGLNGESAVDNQFYRASGCNKLTRGTQKPTQQFFRSFLVELRGVDDLRNDDHVDMGIYSTGDDEVSLKASDGSDVAYQTFTITPNPRWRAQTTARIVDGVLTSAPVPVMHLNRRGGFGAGRTPYTANSPNFVFVGENEFRDVRFRLTMKPDGTFAGVMGNYRPIDNIHSDQYAGGRGTASTANHDCASEYNTLAKFADGYPDPVTGECTMISAAQNITGIPAYVTPPVGETLSAIHAGKAASK